ncbi:MAG: ribokinase [Sciscionella sp.]
MTRPRIVVLGSCVVDLLVSVPRRPATGETVIATDFSMFAGGKGLNQAVGVARSGGDATLIGRIGEDPFGATAIEALDQAGVSREFLMQDPDARTGLGLPLVEPSGANAIVFVPGANACVGVSDVAAAAPAIRRADMLLLQLELPVETAVEAARVAAATATRVLLNAAPAVPVPPVLLGLVDLLVVNEIEAGQLAGRGGTDASTADVASELFRRWEPAAVVVTLAHDGVLIVDLHGARTFPAYAVDTVDAVGAGDAFCAGFAVELCRGESCDDALVYAQAAGALTVTKRGAEPAIPRRAEIDAFMRSRPAPAFHIRPPTR